MTAAGYLCYLRSVHRIIADSHRLPWRDELLKMSPQRLSVIVLFVFISVVLIKAYAIGIVWRCYKYLTIRQHNLRSMLPYIIPDMSARQERDYNTLLPDYEEAIAQSMKQPPPPTYQMAMAYSMANGGLHVNLEAEAAVVATPTDENSNSQPTSTDALPPYPAESSSGAVVEPSTVVNAAADNANHSVDAVPANATVAAPKPFYNY